MTNSLREAFDKAAKLPVEQQDALAALILAELESERRWADLLARSQDRLGALADKAVAEFHAGKTRLFEKDSDLSHN